MTRWLPKLTTSHISHEADGRQECVWARWESKRAHYVSPRDSASLVDGSDLVASCFGSSVHLTIRY